jgi:hypothetical protein
VQAIASQTADEDNERRRKRRPAQTKNEDNRKYVPEDERKPAALPHSPLVIDDEDSDISDFSF